MGIQPGIRHSKSGGTLFLGGNLTRKRRGILYDAIGNFTYKFCVRAFFQLLLSNLRYDQKIKVSAAYQAFTISH